MVLYMGCISSRPHSEAYSEDYVEKQMLRSISNKSLGNFSQELELDTEIDEGKLISISHRK